jgi:hypothetical protein
MARVVAPVAMMVTPPGVLAAPLESVPAMLQPAAPMFQPLAVEPQRAALMHPTVALHAQAMAFPALAPALPPGSPPLHALATILQPVVMPAAVAAEPVFPVGAWRGERVGRIDLGHQRRHASEDAGSEDAQESERGHGSLPRLGPHRSIVTSGTG